MNKTKKPIQKSRLLSLSTKGPFWLREFLNNKHTLKEIRNTSNGLKDVYKFLILLNIYILIKNRVK